MNRNICLLNDSFPPLIDGVANTVVNYAKHIHESHGHALVATPMYPGAKDSDFPYPVIRYPSIDVRNITGYMAGVPFSPDLIGQVQKHNIELLHTHCPIVSTFLARQLRQQIQAPIVLTYHTKFDIDIANVLHNKILQESSIRALVENIKACDEVWAVSKGAGENLRSLGYEGDYKVMPNGVDLSKGKADPAAIEAATKAYDLPEDVPLYLFVGRIMWYKGLRIILDALAQLGALGDDFRMVFIGKGGDMEEVLNCTRELHLEDRCFFTGPIYDREELRAWYTRADLFLFPSTFDTNGLVVREAAACSLASVLIRDSCAAEDVTDRENGFLIEENPESLCALLKNLNQNVSKMKEVGEHASDQLYFSWKQAVDLACQEYEVILDNFHSGKYPRHDTFMDSVFHAQGELAAAIHQVQLQTEDLSSRLDKERKKFDFYRKEWEDDLKELKKLFHQDP